MTARSPHSIDTELTRLSRDIPEMARCLRLDDTADMEALSGIIANRLVPKLHPDLPLLAAVCGGGSSGKSSLFNTLVGKAISPVGGRAGMNRRVLLAGQGDYLARKDILPGLFEPFGCTPEPLADPQDLTTPGGPLYVAADSLPRNLALMDTPDFDTGAGGGYTNRQAARQAMEAADVIIYIFTNSNYGNRDNTDFIAEMLTRIGLRKCFLVYRVYPSFTESDVREHAGTVARHIYGDAADRCILGVYRADEDNEVAAGRRLMTLRPARTQDPPFDAALDDVDTRALRMELHVSILKDVLDMAGQAAQSGKTAMATLRLYADALRTVQDRCTHEALQHFPMDQVLRRFREIWVETDPSHIRFMRKTGALIELPVRLIAGAVKQARSAAGGKPATDGAADYTAKVKEDLIGAVNRLHMWVVGSEISVSTAAGDPAVDGMIRAARQIIATGGISGSPLPHIEDGETGGTLRLTVPAPPTLFHARERVKERSWQSILDAVLARRDVIITLSESMEKELLDLADTLRRRMGLWDKLRQSFAAFLNVVPATAAVTYILYTGDPVGATGIKVKLTGLFGLQDLYALIAIPATSGMKKADIGQLESLLEPMARTWFTHKVKAVRGLFTAELTGAVLDTATETLDHAGQLVERIEDTIKRIGEDADTGTAT